MTLKEDGACVRFEQRVCSSTSGSGDIAYETAVCHSPTVHSFTGDTKVVTAGGKKLDISFE